VEKIMKTIWHNIAWKIFIQMVCNIILCHQLQYWRELRILTHWHSTFYNTWRTYKYYFFLAKMAILFIYILFMQN
jgi:hypothetical protein